MIKLILDPKLGSVGPKRTIRNGTRVLVRDLPEKCHGESHA